MKHLTRIVLAVAMLLAVLPPAIAQWQGPKTGIVDNNGIMMGTSTNPMYVTGAGGGGTGTSSSFGAAFPAAGTAAGLSDGTNMLPFRGDNTYGAWFNLKGVGGAAVSLGQKTTANSIPVALPSDQTVNVAQPDVFASGSIASATPNAAYTVNLANGEATTGFTVTGLTASGATLTIEASDNQGTTWASVNGIAPNTGVLFTTLTTDQQFRVNTAGRTNVRLRVSSTGTGSITAASNASSATGAVALSSPLPAGAALIGGINNAQVSGTAVSVNQGTPDAGTQRVVTAPTISNPTSTLAMTSATTAYTAGQNIATNSNGTLLTVSSFAITNTAAGVMIPRLRLSINDATSTAWGSQTITIDLWSTAPTFASGNGDRGTFLVATGAGVHIGGYLCSMSAVQSDGVYGECFPTVGQLSMPKLASGTSIFWTAQATTGSGVTGASKTMTLTAEVLN